MTRIVLGSIAVAAHPGSPAAQPLRAQPRGERRTVSLDEARAAAGFALRQPPGTSSPELASPRIDLLRVDAPGGPQVAGVLSRFREGPGRWLVLRQIRLGAAEAVPHEIGIPHALREGRIGARPAAFFAHAVPATDLPGGQVIITHCLWEDDGCLLELQAPHLGEVALARIAASLR